MVAVIVIVITRLFLAVELEAVVAISIRIFQVITRTDDQEMTDHQEMTAHHEMIVEMIVHDIVMELDMTTTIEVPENLGIVEVVVPIMIVGEIDTETESR